MYRPPSQFAFAEMCARKDVMIRFRDSDVVHYKEICEKCLRSNYVQMLCVSQPIKINGESSAYFLSLFLWWCDVSSLSVVWRHTFRHGRHRSPKNRRSKRCTSHAWHSTLIVQCTETFLDNTLPGNFGVFSFLLSFFLDKIHHPGARFQLLASAWRFEMTENGSRLTRKWCIRAGIKPNTTTGQLVKTQTPIGCGTTDISDRKKAHAQTVAGKFYAHRHTWDLFFLFFWVRASWYDHERSSAVQCPWAYQAKAKTLWLAALHGPHFGLPVSLQSFGSKT